MEITLLHYTLGGSSRDESFAASALREWSDRLTRECPNLPLTLRPLADPLLTEITRDLSAGLLDKAVATLRAFRAAHPSHARTHLTLYCPDRTHPAARVAQKRLRHAQWGLALSGALALTYSPDNPFALWHESLHLLGAHDHYDLHTLAPTCDLRSCIMQYAPSPTMIGPRPILCPQTRARLQRLTSLDGDPARGALTMRA